MTRYIAKALTGLSAVDDPLQVVVRQDLSGGMNTRSHATLVAENQCELLENADIGIYGQTIACPGLTEIENITGTVGASIFGFDLSSGIDQLIAGVYVSGTVDLYGGAGTGSLTLISGTNFDSRPIMVKCFESGDNGDVVIACDGSHDMVKIDDSLGIGQATDGNTAPPKSNAFDFFRGRLWVLKDNNLYWSSAYPSGADLSDGYLTAFDRSTNAFKIPCGKEMFVLGVRETGLICGGKDEIWGINPSVTPAATDKAEKLLNEGCVSGKTACVVGDDVYYMAADGIRSVSRSVNDKLQYKTSYPLSYAIKTEWESLSWANIDLASAIYFDNKYFLSVPVDSSKYNNEVWIYYPASEGWVVVKGWNVADWTIADVNGEARLFAIDSVTGKIYRAWYGTTNNGANITYTEVCRKEDIGKPLVKKSGGEVYIKAKATGQFIIKVYISLDGSDFEKLGEIITVDNNVSFLTYTLPFTFHPADVNIEKFPLVEYEGWYQAQIKITCSGAIGGDLEILERGIITTLDEYLSQEV